MELVDAYFIISEVRWLLGMSPKYIGLVDSCNYHLRECYYLMLFKPIAFDYR